MNREECLDWLCRLRSEIYVYMPKECIIPMDNALEIAIKALEQTRWIPVSERLPDIHNCFQECLITNKHKSVYKAFFTDINGKQWWSVDDVIAWMSLPQPYESG